MPNNTGSKNHIIILQKIAKQRAGRCLSKKYINTKEKLAFICRKDHIWKATPNGIKNGSWCPKCGRAEAANKKRDSIETMQNLAASRGGRCLSNKYIDNSMYLRWKCAQGHIWKAKPSNIKTGTWCPQCGRQRTAAALKDSIQNMHLLAKKNGGNCLSKEYLGSHSNLKWKCSKGHIWNATPTSIKSGSWCRTCAFQRNANRQRDTISNMKNIAKENGGKCLSKTYVKNNSPLLWQCEQGHIWKAPPANIKMGGWCPYCSGHKFWGDIHQELQKIAIGKGGKLISKKYLDSQTPLKWQCAEGHIWRASASAIKTGQWCARCYGNVRKTISEARAAAKMRGGHCLSKKYERAKAKLSWQCAEGHIWNASWESAIQYSWCPQCNASSSYGERVFRDLLEQIFKTKFPRRRPQWLITNDGKRLELDGYSEDSKIAFEYHGPQHETHVDFFHNGKSTLATRRYYDKQKRRICRKNRVRLIEFPYAKSFSDTNSLMQLIKSKCNSAGIDIPKNFESTKLKISGPFSSQWLEKLRVICKENQGKLLSTAYTGSTSPIKVQCRNKHVWETLPNRITLGNWCPYCAKRKVWQPLETYQKLAHSRGGKLISETYNSSTEKLLWQCKNNHTWKATPTHIKLGTWCPFCSKVRIWGDPYKILQKIAKERKGELLSKRYVNAKSKLNWKCNKGHAWKASPDKVKRGSWCPQCAGKKKK